MTAPVRSLKTERVFEDKELTNTDTTLTYYTGN